MVKFWCSRRTENKSETMISSMIAKRNNKVLPMAGVRKIKISSMDTRVYCSAGINYAVVCPNGDVYRCMADYVGNHLPLFNVKDGWRKEEKPSLCSHPRCEGSCDVRYTTKAIFSPKNDGPKMVQCSDGDCEDFSYLHFPDQPVGEAFRSNVSYHMDADTQM